MKNLSFICMFTACLMACSPKEAATNKNISSDKENAPNVVTIILDDATKTQIELGMPHFVAEIQQRGTVYSSGVFDISLCSPTTANYLTGRIGRENGMTNCNPNENMPVISEGHGILHNGANGLTTGGVGTFDFRTTLLTEMKNAGYKVGWFGKYLNGHAGNHINSVVDGKTVTVNYSDVDASVWKYAGQFPYQPVPPGVDTWRSEFDNSLEPGIYKYKIHVANGETFGTEEQWTDAINFDGKQYQGEHIEYFKREVASYLNNNKGKQKFLTLRLFNPHNAQLEGVLPYINSCNYRQALAHRSARYRNTVDPMSISLPLSLTAFMETVSDSTENTPTDGKAVFPCGVQDGLSHKKMYEMYYRYAMAAAIEALHDYDDLVQQVIDTLKKDGEFDNTLFVLFNDNGVMNGEHGLYHKNKPWKESIELHLVIKYPNQQQPAIVDHHISNTYITPTILDVAGVKSIMPMHAKSLRQLTEGEKNIKILSEGYARLCKKWDFEQVTDGNKNYFIQYYPNKAPEEFLFDSKKDPAELTNLINSNDHKANLEELRQFLKDFPGGPMNIEKNIMDYRNNCN